MHILFVCTGNICRSPTAERLGALYGTRFEIRDLRVSSAGTRAVIGHPIHPESALLLEKLGGDSTKFSARQLSPKIAQSADLIITMSRAQRDWALELAPHKMNQTFTMSEAKQLVTDFGAETLDDLPRMRPQIAGRQPADIPDPFGKSPAVFKQVGLRIAELLPSILSICREAN